MWCCNIKKDNCYKKTLLPSSVSSLSLSTQQTGETPLISIVSPLMSPPKTTAKIRFASLILLNNRLIFRHDSPLSHRILWWYSSRRIVSYDDEFGIYSVLGFIYIERESEGLILEPCRHRCVACFKMFNRRQHLVEHMKISHHSLHQPRCGVCFKHCKSFESVREHLNGIACLPPSLPLMIFFFLSSYSFGTMPCLSSGPSFQRRLQVHFLWTRLYSLSSNFRGRHCSRWP